MVTIDVKDIDVIGKYTVLFLEDNELNFKKVKINDTAYDVVSVLDAQRCCIAIETVLNEKPQEIQIIKDSQ